MATVLVSVVLVAASIWIAIRMESGAGGRGDDRIDVEVGGRARIRPHPPAKPL